MCRCDFRRRLPLLALLCVLDASRAQTVRVFDTQSGLPHNRVNRIYLDSKSFLWICTDGGLSRFDGHQFVNYTMADGIPHNYVNAVLETRAGEYWIASDGGVSRFDPRPRQTRFTTFAPSGPKEARHVNALIEEPDGSLLLGTSSGLYQFRAVPRPGSFERIELGHPRNAPDAVMVNEIARDSRGSLWLATNYGLCHRVTNAGWTHYGVESGLGTEFVSSFADDRNGRLWVAFSNGIGRIAIDPKPGTPVLDFVQRDQPGLGRVRALWFGTDGRRWIATETGLWEWFIESNRVSRFREHAIQDKFPREAVISIREDNAGNLWIGTRRSGLVHMGSSPFQTFGATEGLQLGLDQLLLEVPPGQVAVFDVSGKRNQVYRKEGGRWFAAVLPAFPEPFWLQMAIQDHKGAWWFSTSSGLFRFPTLGGPYDLCLLSGFAVNRFFEDSAGDLWISNWPPGGKFAKLARWERHSGLVHDESERLPPNAHVGIAAFAQDHAGTIWIGLQTPGGLLRLKEGRFEPMSADWRGHINKLFVDSKGRLWATSTESGLGLIADPQSADPQLRRYTKAQGLSADEVWCVTEDRLGRIYAGTAKGVDRLDPGTGQIVHYSAGDGLVRGDIRSSLRVRNGDLWFASAHGVSKFKPSKDRSVPPSRARITGLRAAGVPVLLSEFGETEIGPLRFSSHQNSLQIDFAATDYRVLAPLRYQFWSDREAGADQSLMWRDLGTNSTVHLVNLAPGNFTFKVRALTPDGLPGEPASLTFSILQPFWRTWWFQLACAMAIAGIAWWIRTRRLKQQLALERVRSHIAMDLHDDIGASLSRIAILSEVCKRQADGAREAVPLLTEIADSARSLVDSMRDIVWAIDPRHADLADVVLRIREFAPRVLEARSIQWDFRVQPGIETIRLDPEKRRHLLLFFKEAVNNAIRHAECRSVSLALATEGRLLVAEVRDDGRGLAGAHPETPGSTGHGLRNMETRAEQLGGRLTMESGEGEGTRLRLEIPVRR